ncbi:MAG: DUF1667 domain-containing protein [Bacillota bacterium]
MVKLTCISCPIGCEITAVETPDGWSVSGNTCKRGEVYAKQELTAPKRTITSLAVLANGEVLSCKTSAPVDKADIFAILKRIKSERFAGEYNIGDVLISGIAEGVDIVATQTNI